MADITHVAVLGAGTIGASWAANFLARGLTVTVSDPAPHGESFLRQFIEGAWPALSALGLAPGADPGRVRFLPDPAAAVEGAQFVQENGPERLDAKHALLGAIDAALPETVVIASSTSTLTVSDMAAPLTHPERLVLGHPFNPPHLVPLVEVAGGARTGAAAVETALAFYRQLGKHPIRLKREKLGHVANRLQAALWQEAFHLLLEGVADPADIDAAIAHGPGLRWALLGPFLNLHLSGGAGGIEHMLAHLGPPTAAMWRDLGRVELTAENGAAVARAVSAEVATLDLPAVVAARDKTLAALLRSKAETALP